LGVRFLSRSFCCVGVVMSSLPGSLVFVVFQATKGVAPVSGKLTALSHL
jgi:hypothetical protein